MSSIQTINPNAERTRQAQALAINVTASRGLAEVIKSNLGEAQTGVRGGSFELGVDVHQTVACMPAELTEVSVGWRGNAAYIGI